jgi:hypothetical protein
MTTPTPASTEPPESKTEYRVRNWPEYDRALVQRGSLTVWFDEAYIKEHWTPPGTGKRGAPWVYSDLAIQRLLVLKAVFHLPYRALEGLARSLMQLMGLDLPVPDHTHLSRRAKTLQVTIPRRARQEVTTVDWADGEVFSGLIEQIEGPIEQIDGDGAYDTREVYQAGRDRGAKGVVPPRDNAVPWEPEHPRTQALADIADQGLAEWKKTSGYHRRSLAENAMYRLKQLFGDHLASRLFETQVTEVHARVAAMNMMTALGMPISVRVGTIAS